MLLPMDMSDISKYFKEGEYVKVVSGMHKGTFGSIISINDKNQANIISNTDNLEKAIMVNVNDLKKDN